MTVQEELEELSKKGDWANYAKKYYEMYNFHPSQHKWNRIRFQANETDYRPVIFPAPGPWWCSGSGGGEDDGYSIIVAYFPQGWDLSVYWPDAKNVDVMQEDTTITFSSRFAKPDTWPFD